MADYIEREAFKEKLRKRVKNEMIRSWLCGIINEVHAADVAPVRHGRWERTADGAALCTACKRKMNPSQYGYAFAVCAGQRWTELLKRCKYGK